MCDKQFRLERVVKIWLEVFFYSVIGWTIAFFLELEAFSVRNVIKMFLPILSNTYWYASTYLMMVFFIPLWNYLIRQLEQKQMMYFLGISFIVFSLMPSLGAKWLSDPNSIYIAVVLYFMGAYIKKYKKVMYVCGGGYTPFIVIVTLVCTVISAPILSTLKIAYPLAFIWGPHKTTILLSSIVMFIWFREIQWKNGKITKVCASSVFGVYLFHNGPLLPGLIKILKLEKESILSRYYILYLCFGILIIFVAGVLIDKLRIKLFEQPVLYRIQNCVKQLDHKLEVFFPK